MKKYDNIMKRVRFIENKYGIVYAKPDGKLFAVLKIFYLLAACYTLGINLLYIGGMFLMHYGTDDFYLYTNSLITISACTALMLTGSIMLFSKLKISASIISLASLPLMILTFGTALSDDLGFMGFKTSFYWRHFIPMAIMLILLTLMLIIALRAKYKADVQYKRIVTNLYQMYSVRLGKEENSITDEQWEEFLKSYDPRGYKKQFVKQTEEASDIPKVISSDSK